MKIRTKFPRLSLVASAALVGVLNIAAQQPSQTHAASIALPVYDVASIHENKSGIGTGVRFPDGNFVATNMTLQALLTYAYGIRLDLIYGLPAWAKSTRFDLDAKVSDPDIDALKKITPPQHQQMLAALLAYRFHLKAHIETKTLPVYDLVIAKGGSKLKQNNALPGPPAEPGTPFKLQPGMMMMGKNQLTGIGLPISAFAKSITFLAGRSIIDETGLTGKYDFNLKWTPVELEGKSDTTTDNGAPDFFTALQEQLGLKLEPSKGPVDTLVIDHVEMPTEN